MQTLPESEGERHQGLAKDAVWWRNAVGYEVYIRSFLDTNADGVGDLAGVTAKLGYLAELGVDAVWLTPFFPSPGFDHGYDVADYLDVDPQFGTLADIDALIVEAHRLGLKIFVDVVPNHTSSHHHWFQSAIADVDSPYRDYYLFRPGGPDGGPPNNWVSHFGGSAWTADPAGTGEYYCHLFLPEQPDLNWANPAVLEEFSAILRFWCERGTDGFRIDVAHALMKHPEFHDNPVLHPVVPGMHPTDVFMSYDHQFDLHQIETVEVFRKWRQVVAPYGAVLLGEMDTRDTARYGAFVGNGDALDLGFVLKIGLTGWEPKRQIDDLIEYLQAANGGAAWEVSNHDQARAVSRFGGGEIGLRRALALTTLMVVIDGMTFIYQGEELGLPDAVVTGETEDPMSGRNGGGWGRDVARGGMPWDASAHNGFSSATHTWLETEALPRQFTVEFQMSQPGSTWSRYRDLIQLRKRLRSAFDRPMRLAAREDAVLVVERGPLVAIANFSDHPYRYEPTSTSTFSVEFESVRDGCLAGDDSIVVQPEATVILLRGN